MRLGFKWDPFVDKCFGFTAQWSEFKQNYFRIKFKGVADTEFKFLRRVWWYNSRPLIYKWMLGSSKDKTAKV